MTSDSPEPAAVEPLLRLFKAIVWIGDQPGVRVDLFAEGPEEATAMLEAEYGTGHVYTLWNEQDAERPRG